MSAVEHRVRAGLLDGVEEDGRLYIVRRVTGPEPERAAPTARRPLSEHPALLRIAFWVGTVGFVVSLMLHVASLFGREPSGFGLATVLHLGLFAAFTPAVFGLVTWAKPLIPDDMGQFDFRRQIDLNLRVQRKVLRLIPMPERIALGLLFVYVAVHFVLSSFALDSEIEPSYRLFSGHWMLFYAVSAVLGRRLTAPTEGSA